MKKIFIILCCIFYLISFSLLSAMADEQFEVSIIRCGVPGNPDGCGSNPISTDPLSDGKIKVDYDGTLNVLLIGAVPNTSYRVFVGNWITGGVWQYRYIGDSKYDSLGTVLTDEYGYYDGNVITDQGDIFFFPSDTIIGQPNFAFNNPEWGPTQFTTGFIIQTDSPPPIEGLPENITENNVYTIIQAGTYDHGLTVNGNNFTIEGNAGPSCYWDNGWSVITESVIINKNNAVFKNIKFLSPVIDMGNNTTFENCCFAGW